MVKGEVRDEPRKTIYHVIELQNIHVYRKIKLFIIKYEETLFAFIICKSLKSLEIPDSVTSIGFGAFSYCYFPYKLKQELISRFGDKIFGN